MLPQRNRTSESLHHSKIGQNRPKSQIPFINAIYPKIANFLQLLSHLEKYTSWDWRSWKGPRAKVHCKCIYSSSGKAVKITIKLYIFVLLLSGGCGGSYWEFSKLPRILLVFQWLTLQFVNGSSSTMVKILERFISHARKTDALFLSDI